MDRQALIALAGRYTALADRRRAEALKVPIPAADGVTMGRPSPQALKMASDAIARRFVLPETARHPAIEAAFFELAYLLMAYDMVPPGPAAASDAAGKPGTVEDGSRLADAGRHILVVDDASDALVIVGAFLAGEGLVVRKADDGHEALRLIASDPCIDILITDFAMPGLNGVDLIDQAIRLRPHLRALVITGYPNAAELAALPRQATVLAKPFRRDALIEWMKSPPADRRVAGDRHTIVGVHQCLAS